MGSGSDAVRGLDSSGVPIITSSDAPMNGLGEPALADF